MHHKIRNAHHSTCLGIRPLEDNTGDELLYASKIQIAPTTSFVYIFYLLASQVESQITDTSQSVLNIRELMKTLIFLLMGHYMFISSLLHVGDYKQEFYFINLIMRPVFSTYSLLSFPFVYFLFLILPSL